MFCYRFDYSSTCVLLVLLCTTSLVVLSNDIKGLLNAVQAELYQFTYEEAQTYWKKKHNYSTYLEWGNISNHKSRSLRKRSVESMYACLEMNHDLEDKNGQFVGRHTYKWLTARCKAPFETNEFEVHCEHTFERRRPPWATFLDYTSHTKYCPEHKVCVPSSNIRVNGAG